MQRVWPKGMALPVILLVVCLILLVGTAVTTLGTGSLLATRSSLNSDRAAYAAEAGLAAAAEELATTGELPQPFEGDLSTGEGSYQVSIWPNDGEEELEIEGGLKLPPHTTYLQATGTSREGTRRVVGALFRSGIGAFQVGALADNFTGNNARFDAYNSDKEPAGYTGSDPDPSTVDANAAILATNENYGDSFVFNDTDVNGAIYVGPGGDKGKQIKKNNANVSKEGVLLKKIEVPPIEIPTDLTAGKSSGSGDSGDDKKSATPSVFKYNSCTVYPPSKPGDPITYSKYCMTLKVWEDGRFTASETGSSSTASGNIKDQKVTSNQGKFKVSFEPFNINGAYHQVILDYENSKLGIEPGSPKNPHVPAIFTDMPDWLKFYVEEASGGGDPSVDNPETLEPGRYSNVFIDSVKSKLKGNSSYLIDNLTVKDLGSLLLTDDEGVVNLYVTGTLTLDGIDTVLNQTRKAPKLRIYYTGTDPVVVSGGSSAYFTLYAPNAEVELNGFDSSFYGATVGKKVTVNNAKFHFDTATRGIGTGSEGAALTLLARYRD